MYQALLVPGKFKKTKQREALGDQNKKNTVYLSGEIITYLFDSDLETDTREHKNKKTGKVTTTEHHIRTSYPITSLLRRDRMDNEEVITQLRYRRFSNWTWQSP